MITWLVRRSWRESGKEWQQLVGMVAVENMEALFATMDEYDNPHDFEYRAIPKNSRIGFVEGEYVGDEFEGFGADEDWHTFSELVGDFDTWYEGYHNWLTGKERT